VNYNVYRLFGHTRKAGVQLDGQSTSYFLRLYTTCTGICLE